MAEIEPAPPAFDKNDVKDLYMRLQTCSTYTTQAIYGTMRYHGFDGHANHIIKEKIVFNMSKIL